MPAEQQPRVGIAPDFKVGDWLVEPSLDRVSRDGTIRRLRPQLIDLLVVLARHAGRTVPKEVLLDEVWRTQNVAESGLTRCITEIRQALEDDAHRPWMVLTVPKRGYRLVAPVEFLVPDRPVDVAMPSTPAEPMPDAAPQAAGARAASRTARWTLVSIPGVLLLAAGVWAVVAWGTPLAHPEPETVLLADVVNSTGDEAFDRTLKLALAVELGQAPFLQVLSDEHVYTALVRSGRPHTQPLVGAVALDICRREGAALLLAGSISRLDTHYAVGLEATACKTGESVARELVDVDRKDSVIAALGEAADRLRRKLGESRESLETYDVPIVEATTPSLEALQALSVGDFNRDHARLTEALESYRRATELDPQFALAWARRGAVARNLGKPEEEIPSFERAYALRDRVSEAERLYILGHYYRLVANDPDKAVDTYRIWSRTYPGSATPAVNLASLTAFTFGRYDEALAPAREAVRLAPYSSVALRVLVVACLATGRVDEAREAMRAASARGSADLVWHLLAFQMAFVDGDLAAMQAHADWAAGEPAALALMTREQALAAASRGRLGDARRLFAEAASTAVKSAPPVRVAGLRGLEALTEALLGDPGRARAAAESAVAASRDPGTLQASAVALALAGRPDLAGPLVAESARGQRLTGQPVALSVARALIEAAAGRSDRARDTIREVARFERGRDFGLTPLGVRGWIELGAGRAREAAATFRTVLQLQPVCPTSPWIAFARVGLARALRAAGDLQGSRAAYDAAIASFAGADADAPLLLAAQKELAALPLR